MEKKYDFSQSEQQARELWQKDKVYKAKNNPGEPYSVDFPPPTASGSLHIGHVFSYTQTDIIVRYKRMNGFSPIYPFGIDGNGLATERFVEKKLKIRGIDMKRSEFIKLCLQETELMEKDFKALWQRMALSIDWDLCYSTISDRVMAIAQASFIKLFEKGYIFRQQEPALYCPVCRTTVAQAELDDAEKESFFNDIVFKDEKGNELIVGTTRPEMLPACVALFYHPDDTRYQKLKGRKALVPLFDYYVPILENEAVDPDKGTGLVMCCTFGDKADILWYKQYELPYRGIFGPEGRLNGHVGILADLTVKEARGKVIEELVKFNLLRGQKPIVHTVNVHERCKNEIEFIVITQWFINLLNHKKAFLTMADQVHWFPAYMKSRYIDWVENLGWDWCISRQRFYGVPFPVWHCMNCDAVILANADELPIDPQETPYKGTCACCGSKDIKPDTDVMDTWNTSSLTPYIVFDVCSDAKAVNVFDDPGIKDFIPMSMRPQAHDIIRTWAFYTMVKSWMHQGEVPWKSIVISGHVLMDNKGKISKSKGGVDVTPEGLLEKYPADAIRFWTASGALGTDVAFSESQMQIGKRLITKLWNAFRFVHEHIAQCAPSDVPQELGAINEWLLQTASECFKQYHKHFEANEFSLALDQIEKLFWKHFCDNYLEIIKDQLFNPDRYKEGQVCATRWTLHNVGMRILQMYAPFMPYVTETLYQLIYRPSYNVASIHQTRFAEIQAPFFFNEVLSTADAIMKIVVDIRRLKTEKQLSLKMPIAHLTIATNSIQLSDDLKKYEQMIKGVTQAQEITHQPNGKDEVTLYEKDGQWHAVVYCEALPGVL